VELSPTFECHCQGVFLLRLLLYPTTFRGYHDWIQVEERGAYEKLVPFSAVQASVFPGFLGCSYYFQRRHDDRSSGLVDLWTCGLVELWIRRLVDTNKQQVSMAPRTERKVVTLFSLACRPRYTAPINKLVARSYCTDRLEIFCIS
jgi:hypothetical protein